MKFYFKKTILGYILMVGKPKIRTKYNFSTIKYVKADKKDVEDFLVFYSFLEQNAEIYDKIIEKEFQIPFDKVQKFKPNPIKFTQHKIFRNNLILQMEYKGLYWTINYFNITDYEFHNFSDYLSKLVYKNSQLNYIKKNCPELVI